MGDAIGALNLTIAHGCCLSGRCSIRSLFEALQTVPDPHRERGIAAMALLCGCRDVKAIHRFASPNPSVPKSACRLNEEQRGFVKSPATSPSTTCDATRSRNPNLVGNLALLRNALLAIVAEEREIYGSLPLHGNSTS